MRLLALLILSSAWLAGAEDTRIGAIRDLLLPMRSVRNPVDARGATPALTMVKHQLIDWIESRLAVLKWNGSRWSPNPIVFQEQLNEELNQAGLFCDSPSNAPCPQDSELGFLGRIVVDMQDGSLLVVRTAVGIQLCGFDESAYAYRSNESQWVRFWESEQNGYQEDKYFPQLLDQVLISAPNFGRKADKSEHLILTLGHEPWCTSNWHDIYYRVWQTSGSGARPLLLLEGKEMSFIDSIRGSVNSKDVFFEYNVNSVEGGFTRHGIRHYVLRDRRLERVDPVALSPRDFTSFWLTHRWPEISQWTAPDDRSKLAPWMGELKGPFSLAYPTLRCIQHPDLWQVSADVGEDGKEQVHFLIRWRPPYHFMMVSGSNQPWPDCTEEDRDADESKSLFALP